MPKYLTLPDGRQVPILAPPPEQPIFTLPAPVEPPTVEKVQIALPSPPEGEWEPEQQPRPGILDRAVERISSLDPEQLAKPASDMSDLFEVPQPEDNDIFVDDLLELDPEEDMEDFDDLSDLTKVEMDDIMGRPPKQRPAQRFRRTNRPYSGPTSLGGIR